MTSQLDYWVLIPAVDKGKPASYLEQVDFVTKIDPSDPDYALLKKGQAVNLVGQSMVAWKGPYATQTEAQTAAAAKPGPGPGEATQNFVQGSLPGLAGIGDFFSRLSEGSTWIRVAEVIVGIGLIIAGLATVAKGTPIGQAAATAAKGAALL